MTVVHKIRERPIIFSGEMVQALLEGRKTQTRRLVKLPAGVDLDGHGEWQGHRVVLASKHNEPTGTRKLLCPKGVPGDRLWVKERWGLATGHKPYDPRAVDVAVRYFADGEVRAMQVSHALGGTLPPNASTSDRRSPLFMPRWASRLTLEITDVRVQKLAFLREEDAQAEGVHQECPYDDCDDLAYECTSGENLGAGHGYTVPRWYGAGFRNAWDRIHGKGSYDSEPLVWAITFRRLDAAARAA